MILAAGRGERMRPVTDTLPKPLLQVGKHTLIEHHLLRLAAAGIDTVVINLCWLGDLIRDSVGNGDRYNLTILYSDESSGALETAGGIVNALPLLGSKPFLLVNGDIFTDIDFSALRRVNPGADGLDMHLVLVPNPAHHMEGDFCLPDAAGIHHLVEHAQSTATPVKRHTYSGVGVYQPQLFTNLNAGKRALAPIIHQAISNGSATGEFFSGQWLDVGTIERLEQARLLAGSLR